MCLGDLQQYLDYSGAYRHVDSNCNIVACGSLDTGDEGSAVFVLSPDGVVQECDPVLGDQPTRCKFGDPGLYSLYITTETASSTGLATRIGKDRSGLYRD